MVFGCWEMAASFVTSGVLNEELFFQNCGECVVLWEKVRNLLPEMRAAFNNAMLAKNLETVGNRYIEWMNKRAPGSYEGFQKLVQQSAGGR